MLTINKRVENGPGSNKPVAPISRLLFSPFREEPLIEGTIRRVGIQGAAVSRTRAMYGSADVVGGDCRSADDLIQRPCIEKIYFQTWRSCWLAGECRLERAAAGEAWMATASGQAGRNLCVHSAVGLAGLDFQL